MQKARHIWLCGASHRWSSKGLISSCSGYHQIQSPSSYTVAVAHALESGWTGWTFLHLAATHQIQLQNSGLIKIVERDSWLTWLESYLNSTGPTWTRIKPHSTHVTQKAYPNPDFLRIYYWFASPEPKQKLKMPMPNLGFGRVGSVGFALDQVPSYI